MLCDVGAAELVFPRRWFVRDAAAVASAADLLLLAASVHRVPPGDRRDGTRNCTPDAVAAVFLSWKLKPTQEAVVGREESRGLFGITAAEEIRDALKLRIDYAIPSESFAAAGRFFPATSQSRTTVRCTPQPHPASRVTGSALWSSARRTARTASTPSRSGRPTVSGGPRREYAVAAVVRPVAVQQPRRKRRNRRGQASFDLRCVLPGEQERRLARSEDLLAAGPLVVTFYRGGWCP